MSWSLDQTNQSNHVSNYFNDYPHEIDDNDDLYADEDTISFIKSLKPIGNSFALVRKSNGDPTFLLYEGLGDGEDCDNDFNKRMTRSSTRKIQGSNFLSINANPSGLAGNQENDQNNGAENNFGLNCGSKSIRARRKNKSRVKNKASGDGHSGNGADTRKVASNNQLHNLRPRKNQNPSVIKKLRDDGLSDKADRVARGLANGDHSGKGDMRRARRLSGLRYRKGLVRKRKNDKEGRCVMEALGSQEALDDQDYGHSNRAYDIWLRDYNTKIYDLKYGNAESDSEIEVLDKDPLCIEWNDTRLADSNILDATMEDDDLRYIGERSKPENPQFRKDVVDILGRPYDEEEYETLWLQVNSRKAMQGYRELRGRLKSYSKNVTGKSYLDEYLDLGRKLDTFKTDLPRKLNVLRGFFYYLKSIASDGIFKPWLDESCLTIVPRTE